MRIPLPCVALLLVGCAHGGGAAERLPVSERGFATAESLGCARLLLEQRGYRVHVTSRRGDLRAEKSFTSRDRDLVVHGIITALFAPADDGRTTLWVRATRRVAHGNPPVRRKPGARLETSAYFDAAEAGTDARAVLAECTLGAA